MTVTTSSLSPTRPRSADRLAGAFLIVVMAVGCLVLWIGLPVAILYGTSRIAETSTAQFLLALPGTLVAMIVFAGVLFWVNRLYLRVSVAGREDDDDEWDDYSEEPRFARGPLEPMLVASLIVALIALFVWFFGFAHNPSRQVI